jgi:hypothetical protein
MMSAENSFLHYGIYRCDFNFPNVECERDFKAIEFVGQFNSERYYVLVITSPEKGLLCIVITSNVGR